MTCRLDVVKHAREKRQLWKPVGLEEDTVRPEQIDLAVVEVRVYVEVGKPDGCKLGEERVKSRVVGWIHFDKIQTDAGDGTAGKNSDTIIQRFHKRERVYDKTLIHLQISNNKLKLNTKSRFVRIARSE